LSPASLTLVIGLMVVFQLKHFVADYPLQVPFMLRGKSRGGFAWLGPLAVHCGVHAALTLVICAVIQPRLWWLALVDFTIHFAMDRIKASPVLLGRFHDPESRPFWFCLGVDQMVHHLTSIFIVWALCAL
jgi:hypothetical protein